MSLKEGYNICKAIDKKTTEMSFSKVMLLTLKSYFELIIEKRFCNVRNLKLLNIY